MEESFSKRFRNKRIRFSVRHKLKITWKNSLELWTTCTRKRSYIEISNQRTSWSKVKMNSNWLISVSPRDKKATRSWKQLLELHIIWLQKFLRDNTTASATPGHSVYFCTFSCPAIFHFKVKTETKFSTRSNMPNIILITRSSKFAVLKFWI